MSSPEKEENIKVCIRVRPPSTAEPSAFEIKGNSVVIPGPSGTAGTAGPSGTAGGGECFTFDRVYNKDATQERIFKESVEEGIEHVCSGYNCTVFAYGTTGCLSPETKVRMYDGSLKRADRVQIGDLLEGVGEGYAREKRVVQATFWGIDHMFEVYGPNNRLSYTVNSSHVLSLYDEDEGKIVDTGILGFLLDTNRRRGITCVQKDQTYRIHKYRIKIRYKGLGFFAGFYLDGNHRFLLKNRVLTHNSGKSYTMFGASSDKRGIIPRACEYLFERINKKESVRSASMRCSFIEIYRENIRDLFGEGSSLRLRNDSEKGVYVQGAVEKHVYGTQEILALIKEGAEQRSTSSTALNNTSSRSHAVLTLYLSQGLSDGTEIHSKLHLIDLAGSENVKKSEVSGVSLQEAQTINKSLSCLGNVIYALTDKSREHIPYRDSKLTFLLQDSLGGNAKTVLIVTLSTQQLFLSETLNSLRFARRAKDIKNKPRVNSNQSIPVLEKVIAELQEKISGLEARCEDYKKVIDAVSEAGKEEHRVSLDVEASKSIALYKTKAERVELRVSILEKQKEEVKKEVEMYKKLFEDQRKLSRKNAESLENMRMWKAALHEELEQYKIYHSALKDAVERKDFSSTEEQGNLVVRIVQEISIRKSQLVFHEEVHDEMHVEEAEISSPRE